MEIRKKTMQVISAVKWRMPKYKEFRAIPNGFNASGRIFITSFPRIALSGIKRSRYLVGIIHAGFSHKIEVVLRKELLGNTNPLKNKKRPRGFKGEISDNIAKPLLARARIVFEKDSVVIDLLQGEWKENAKAQAELDRFKQLHKLHWASFLVETVEKQAEKCGFKEVKILNPVHTLSYARPAIRDERYRERGNEKLTADIREKMTKLYEAVARERGYIIEGKYFVKQLTV